MKVIKHNVIAVARDGALSPIDYYKIQAVEVSSEKVRVIGEETVVSRTTMEEVFLGKGLVVTAQGERLILDDQGTLTTEGGINPLISSEEFIPTDEELEQAEGPQQTQQTQAVNVEESFYSPIGGVSIGGEGSIEGDLVVFPIDGM